ncbi:Ankyrin repeats containing protein [Cardinium endosymbiont of Sogatella furcifera]|uniref:ankyrin repeat domain-containing protein n=1 Tax=Cardinium endosymbiont of Sogatella furcifera TaxID=650378 RepID=UPI000E0D9F9B|nr:ankyrin repeat domain-containing protein [Cardinium endosymbiont of Sogatella furcifera]AXI24486.1 Ankyrin repeats containing protein [Cardinium endosymbiont of Sogatella furcifera]
MQAKLVLFSLVLSYITSCSTINKYSIGFKDTTSNETSKKRSADSFDDTEPSCKLSRSYAEEFDDPDKVYIFRELYDCIYECQSKRLKNLLLENCKGNAKSDKWLNKISRHKINGQNQTSIKNEFPLLHTAIIFLGFTQERSNLLEIIKVLVKHLSIDVNNTHNGEVDAPLFYALDSGDPKVIQVLLAQEDINIHITDKCGHSLFGLARYSCNCSDEARITILQALLKKHGVTCKDHDIDGELLKLACKSRDEHLAKYLMDNRSIKISSDYLHTIIHTAINSGRKAIVNALLNSESNVIPVNEVDQYGNTPLYLAVEKYLEAKNDLEA